MQSEQLILILFVIPLSDRSVSYSICYALVANSEYSPKITQYKMYNYTCDFDTYHWTVYNSAGHAAPQMKTLCHL